MIYSPGQIALIKKAHDLAQVVTSQYPDMRHMGNGDWLGLCPFHNEDTPSFRVNAQRFHCFGCGARGDIVEWLIKTKGLTFNKAINLLKDGVKIDLKPLSVDWRPKCSEYDAVGRLRIIISNDRAQSYYQSQIQSKGMTYIRGLSVLDNGIGYAPLESGPFITYMMDGGFTIQELLEASHIQKDSSGKYYARLRDRWTIPLLSPIGEILGFAGRLTHNYSDLPKYINPANNTAFQRSRFLYGLDTARSDITKKLDYLIIVEGYFDALQLKARGLSQVIAICGRSMSHGQWEYIQHLTDRPIFMLDGDMPGLTGLVDIAKLKVNPGVKVYGLLLTKDQDPDSWTLILPPGDIRGALNQLPRIPLLSLQSEVIWYSGMTKEIYDRTILDRLSHPYVVDNISSGFAHYNCVDWVMAAYPLYAPAIKEAVIALRDDCEILSDGTKKLKEERVRDFLRAWVKPCAEVRKANKK